MADPALPRERLQALEDDLAEPVADGDLEALGSLRRVVESLYAPTLDLPADRALNGAHVVLLLRRDERVRVTDGVRMVMHHMLFSEDLEPTLPLHAPMTAAELYAYAERNEIFISDHGVCAGPRAMMK